MFQNTRLRASKLQQKFGRDTSGSLAIEFAAVSMPFLMLLFGTIAAGLYYFTTFSLENAVEQAARQIRTGQAQMASMTTDQFKADVCTRATSILDCNQYLRVNVIEYNNFAAVSPPSCLDSNGGLIADPSNTAVPGAADNIVLVVACYEWTLAGVLPFLKLGKMANGSAMIQAATTFRTEPYS